jgi:hypothetical protein
MLLGMNWDRRLREMILAGGALAATACDGSTSAAQIGDATARSDDGSHFVCCNADPDPCCTCTGVIADFDAEYGCGQEMAYQAAGGTWEATFMGGQPDGGVAPPHCEFEASDVAEGGPSDAALESSSATSLQCGAGTISGPGTDQCINAGGVCVQAPNSSCCDFVPGFAPGNSGCPSGPVAIRCCALDGGAGKGAADASVE